jgi:hypothetical protein
VYCDPGLNVKPVCKISYETAAVSSPSHPLYVYVVYSSNTKVKELPSVEGAILLINELRKADICQ